MSGRNTPYTPPEFGIGQTVLFYPMRDKRDTPIPAIVTQGYGRATTLLLLRERTRQTTFVSGVHHWDDPIHGDPDYNGGYWDHTADTKLLYQIRDFIVRLDPNCGLAVEDPLPDEALDSLVTELYTHGRAPEPTATKADIGAEVLKLRADMEARAKAKARRQPVGA